MVEDITLVNTVTDAKIEVNMNEGPYFTDYVDWGAVESSNQSYKYVDQIGVHVTGTTLETRQVTIAGWIADEREYEVQKLKKALNTFVNPKQIIEIYYSGYKLSMHPSKSVVYSQTFRENNNVICHFLILGMCADPLFSLADNLMVSGMSEKPQFMFPWVIPEEGYVMGIKELIKKISVMNKGAIETGMLVEFTSKGAVVNPSLTNLATQQFIKINKTLVSGETVRINTNHGQKKVEGIIKGQSSNYYRYRDLDSSWLTLPVGETIFSYWADENVDSLEIRIIYSDKFLEVQI